MLKRTTLSMCTAALVAACAAGSPEHVTYVDADFSLAERAEIDSAMDAWERAVPGVGFADRRTVPHADLLGMVLEREPGAAYVIREDCNLTVARRTSCLAYTSTPSADGATPREESDPARISFCADRIRNWRSVALHELGHARGLRHLPSGNVMSTGDPQTTLPREPTAADVEAMAAALRGARP